MDCFAKCITDCTSVYVVFILCRESNTSESVYTVRKLILELV